MKENLDYLTCLVILDFSENYSFRIQDAVQGFLWNNLQATVHHMVVYLKDFGEFKHQSICFVSDHMAHNTIVVYAFQEVVISYLKERLPDIWKMMYFSNGCTNQYEKLHKFRELVLSPKWLWRRGILEFFATSHGKMHVTVLEE